MPPLLKLRTQAVVGHSGKHVLAAESIGTGEWASGRLQQHQYYTVILQRPARFYSLGMVIAKTADNRGILICAVNGGLAGDWNETAEHWQELQSEDVIVEVNGITGHSEELLRRCREDMTLELRVQRTGGPGSSSERAAAAACGFMVESGEALEEAAPEGGDDAGEGRHKRSSFNLRSLQPLSTWDRLHICKPSHVIKSNLDDIDLVPPPSSLREMGSTASSSSSAPPCGGGRRSAAAAEAFGGMPAAETGRMLGLGVKLSKSMPVEPPRGATDDDKPILDVDLDEPMRAGNTGALSCWRDGVCSKCCTVSLRLPPYGGSGLGALLLQEFIGPARAFDLTGFYPNKLSI
eukprot:TRINITY_DN9324_c0_g1_i3.p1 TRINITY_DN9324_c0_g1~~TRINITY_DN9324_c0_g1_i3.p1  ORF type:complete len:349 (-),score=53.87 TRINITY_DN9324_c0_g1_i3:132-1178(-)